MKSWLPAAILVAVFVLAITLVIAYEDRRGNDACVSLGYRESQALMDGTVYCVTRIHGSDLVVPLLRARPVEIVLP